VQFSCVYFDVNINFFVQTIHAVKSLEYIIAKKQNKLQKYFKKWMYSR